MEIDYLVAGSVADYHQHGALVGLVPVLEEGLDATVYLFFHC